MGTLIRKRIPMDMPKPILKKSGPPFLTARLGARGILCDLNWNSERVHEGHKKNAMEASRQLGNIEQWERQHTFYQDFHDFLVVTYELYNKLSEHEPFAERDDLIDYLNNIRHEYKDTDKLAYTDMSTGEIFNDDFRRDLTRHHKVFNWKKFYKFWNQEIETLIKYHEVCFHFPMKRRHHKDRLIKNNVLTAEDYPRYA